MGTTLRLCGERQQPRQAAGTQSTFQMSSESQGSLCPEPRGNVLTQEVPFP